MVLTYQDCVDRYGNDYQIKKEISRGNLFMQEKGIYSTERYTSETEVVMQKYPRAVFTGKSAFYHHSLTDTIPDHYYLATRRSDARIKDPRIRQSFLKNDIFEAGITQIRYNKSTIRIYNRERMLIELMRFKSRIPLDYYKEVIQNYRRITYELDYSDIEDYASMFKNGPKLMDMIQMEVL